MAITSSEVINGIKYYYKNIELPRTPEGKRVRKRIRAKTIVELIRKFYEFKKEQNLL